MSRNNCLTTASLPTQIAKHHFIEMKSQPIFRFLFYLLTKTFFFFSLFFFIKKYFPCVCCCNIGTYTQRAASTRWSILIFLPENFSVLFCDGILLDIGKTKENSMCLMPINIPISTRYGMDIIYVWIIFKHYWIYTPSISIERRKSVIDLKIMTMLAEKMYFS